MEFVIKDNGQVYDRNKRLGYNFLVDLCDNYALKPDANLFISCKMFMARQSFKS